MVDQFQRTAFETSRLLEFFSKKELQMQIGHGVESWPIALLKELIDNALDACEAARIRPEITVRVEPDAVSVQDNGSGLPKAILEKSLDYAIRVSDKSHYVSPTRGQLGNALKCVWAAPFVIDGEAGCIEVMTPVASYQVQVALDRIQQSPRLELIEQPPVVKNGTIVKMRWPDVASFLKPSDGRVFYNIKWAIDLVSEYAALNPHASFAYSDDEYDLVIPAGSTDWQKWTPNSATSPHWYTLEQLGQLIAAYIAHESNGGPAKTVREFVSEFRGLSSSGKQKAVCDAAGLSKSWLHELTRNNDIDRSKTGLLLSAMQSESRPVKAQALGAVGEAALSTWLRDFGCSEDTVQYNQFRQDDGLPFIVEVAFGVLNRDARRYVFTGMNWTPLLTVPISALNTWLADAMVDSYDNAVVIVHVVCPSLQFTDRGKSLLDMPEVMNRAAQAGIQRVTKHWQRLKRQMKRDHRATEKQIEQWRKAQRRRERSIKDYAYEVMEAAYLFASDDNSLPANARQIMYAARNLILNIPGGKVWKNSEQFTQGYLVDFQNDCPQLTADWDVVYDARGHFIEPHTGKVIALGTLDVRHYIDSWALPAAAIRLPRLETDYPTDGPGYRFEHVLFVEKEGFMPILDRSEIAKTHDIGIMSTKGMTVTAARSLIEHLTACGVRIYVVRDFDKTGCEIAYNMMHDTDRYQYRISPNVTDVGLFLVDAQAMNLQSEEVGYSNQKDPRANLRRCGVDEDEINFLVQRRRGEKQWTGERIELNAMSSRQFVNWIESNLQRHGIGKIVPDKTTLEAAYRRATMLIKVQEVMDQTMKAFDNDAVDLPADIEQEVRNFWDRNGETHSWDQVVLELVRANQDKT